MTSKEQFDKFEKLVRDTAKPEVQKKSLKAQKGEDWFLKLWINAVNETGVGFGVTFSIGGFLVSGTLIGTEEYFETWEGICCLSWCFVDVLQRSNGYTSDHCGIWQTQW